MGFEEISQIFRSINDVLSRASSSLSSVLAWAGIILIGMVISYYLVVGTTKAIKLLIHMKARYLGVFVLVLGVVLLTMAIIIP